MRVNGKKDDIDITLIDNETGEVVTLREETRRRRQKQEEKYSPLLTRIADFRRRNAEHDGPMSAQMQRLQDVNNRVQRDYGREMADMVMGALDQLGGQDWLVLQALMNPVAFMSLVRNLMPQQTKLTVKREGDPSANGFMIEFADGPGDGDQT